MATLYSRALLIAMILTVLLVTVYIIYQYYFAPLPGDTTSVNSYVFRKHESVPTNIEETVAKDVKMTNSGAFSCMFSMTAIPEYTDEAKILIPVLSLYKQDPATPLQKGQIVSAILVNRLSSDLTLAFYNTSGDMYTVPITTGPLKQKTSIVVRLMNTSMSNSFLVNVYLNGEFIVSRGIPSSFIPTGLQTHTIVSGSNNGTQGKIQLIRVWEDARHLTEDDIVKVSQDPFSV